MKTITTKQQTAHEFVLAQSVQSLSNLLHAGLTPAEMRERAAQEKAVITKLADFQMKERISNIVLISAMLLAAAGLYSYNLEQVAELNA